MSENEKAAGLHLKALADYYAGGKIEDLAKANLKIAMDPKDLAKGIREILRRPSGEELCRAFNESEVWLKNLKGAI